IPPQLSQNVLVRRVASRNPLQPRLALVRRQLVQIIGGPPQAPAWETPQLGVVVDDGRRQLRLPDLGLRQVQPCLQIAQGARPTPRGARTLRSCVAFVVNNLMGEADQSGNREVL